MIPANPVRRYRMPLPRSLWALILGLALALNGCTWLIKPPNDQPEARRLIQAAVGLNAGLNQYKCLARAHLHSEGQSLRGRIALAAVAPNQMRVEWLSALGQPLTSMAGDGETITLVSHADRKFYRLPQTRSAMERLVHIPIGIEELLTILAGRPPLPPHVAAQIVPARPRRSVIVLKNRWRGTVAQLEIDLSSGRLKNMQAYDGMGNMLHEVQWRQWRREGGYLLPGKVSIQAGHGQRLTLTMDRFWPNVEVAPGMFVLSPLAGIINRPAPGQILSSHLTAGGQGGVNPHPRHAIPVL